ncbi:hypothetical protein [Cognaticolwellia mytili]|uniref:hypothetical protein n=1 Tax=Cognaticolwellia mytili TaxID=1888913 RepID=UPI000A16FD15|nr:hypothetical protein [Cognaticolwellia mytili]
MPALTKNRATPWRKGEDVNDPVAAGEKIFQGSIVMLDAAKNAVKGKAATNLIARGVASAEVNNVGGAAGAASIASRKGVHRFMNDGSIARIDVGNSAYVVDDQTVAKASGGTRSALGSIIDVDAQGVWVEIA